MARHAAAQAEAQAAYDPHKDARATGDAYKTLFVGRLDYSVDEALLRREFEHFGPIRSLRLVADARGRSRGYAFIEFERDKDLKLAFKEGDQRRLGPRGHRPLIDVERARTVKDWRPRRLGGGLGAGRPDRAPKGGSLPPPVLPPLPVVQPSAGLKRAREDEHDERRDEKRRREDDEKRRDDRDKDREREREKERSKDRERERDREREKERERERERGRERDRERERGADRERRE